MNTGSAPPRRSPDTPPLRLSAVFFGKVKRFCDGADGSNGRGGQKRPLIRPPPSATFSPGEKAVRFVAGAGRDHARAGRPWHGGPARSALECGPWGRTEANHEGCPYARMGTPWRAPTRTARSGCAPTRQTPVTQALLPVRLCRHSQEWLCYGDGQRPPLQTRHGHLAHALEFLHFRRRYFY